ncbi:MAG: catechol-2,3-dioxygenase [Saprospiraceae bacterium]|jgi:catechol-2,3-dioxygenase
MIGNKIKGLGEVIIRVNNLTVVKQFYKEVLGLKVLAEKTHFVFFKIAEGFDGHPQILGLFDNSIPPAFGQIREQAQMKNSSLHHLALEIDKDDYDSILNTLTKNEVEVETKVFNWVQWKSIYLQDPEMNIVELVCFDPTIEKKEYN